MYTVAGTGTRWEGREGAARFYTELLTAFPDIHFDLDYIVIGPQGVCEEAIVTATHEGRWLDHEPTGEQLEWRNAILLPLGSRCGSSRARWSTPTSRSPPDRTRSLLAPPPSRPQPNQSTTTPWGTPGALTSRYRHEVT